MPELLAVVAISDGGAENNTGLFVTFMIIVSFIRRRALVFLRAFTGTAASSKMALLVALHALFAAGWAIAVCVVR
ncbi:hypothetical protein NL529_31390, partial [Klebsiella pneumoniae]|nr:hypothetical protein [Klebsiella pneumoniae]